MGPRSVGWEDRLTRVIRDWRKQRYDWSEPCGIFMADCVVAVAGRDPLADVRGRLLTKRDWAAWLRREGGKVAALTRRVGPEIPTESAIMGDVLLADGAVGIHIGCGGAFLMKEGLGMVPLSECEKAWAVGRG